jgi:hypothetical protein
MYRSVMPARLLRAAGAARAVALALICATGLPDAAQAAVIISAAPTRNLACSNSICTPTADKAVLNAAELVGMLNTANVEIVSAAPANTIIIKAAVTWVSHHKLTLKAERGVIVEAPVTVAGKGSMAIATGKRGDLVFVPGASLSLWDLSSNLWINGLVLKLENRLDQLASDIAANPSGAFAFARDYDAAADGKYHKGVVATPFGGTFEGLGHAIRNIKIVTNANDCIGLFSRVDGATLRDIRLTDVDMSLTATGTLGALAGCTSTGSVFIANAAVDGILRAAPNSAVGGLVGAVYGTIVNTSSSATVMVTGDSSSQATAGGLIGYIRGTIYYSHATGAVSGGANTCAGGLAGRAYSIVRSYATGAVTTGNFMMRAPNDVVGTGGLACVGSAAQSFATGTVTAGDYNTLNGYRAGVGGLMGVGAYITDCYANGAVHGGAFAEVGGLVGDGDHIQHSYASGAVSGDEPESRVGGLVGLDNFPGSFFQTYWDVTTTGAAGGAGAPQDDFGMVGLSTSQLQTKLPKGFSGSIWALSPAINGGLPYLRGAPPP